MRRFFTLAVLLLAALHTMAQTDFNTAQAIAAGETKTGTVGAGNRNVYFKTLLPEDGTVTVYLQGEHKAGNAGSVDFYAYDKSKNQILVKYTLGGKNISLGEKFKDTVQIYSRAADSIYLLVYQNSSQTFDFKLSYEVKDQSANDTEPNDAFSQPLPLQHQQNVKGHIGYIKDNQTDRNDYYKTLLPKSGTVTIYVEGLHTGGYAGSLNLYAYDKSKRHIQVKYTLGGKNISLGEKFKDTIRIYSRSADSLYIQLYQGSSQSFSYSLQYEVTDQNIDDAEPNDDFSHASAIIHEETKYGRIGHVANGVTDRNDYYKTLLPATGTVTLYIQGTHTGGNAGSFDLYVYDKSHKQVQVKYTLGGKNITLGQQFSDTIQVFSRSADTLYFLLYQGSSQSFDYSIRYEITRQSPDDKEPNNTFTEALPIAPNDTVFGRIGYVANSITDRNDYYMAVPEADGTVTVYIRGTHTGGRAGSLNFYVFDKSQRQIMVKYTLGGKNISLGEQFFDTIRVYSRAADTLYFSPYQGSSQSFDYAISYEVLDQSTNDQEPNNDFAQALPLPYQEVVEGHIGYVANNITDRNDYYMAVPEADGTVTVYIRGTHTGGKAGSLDFYVFDKSKRQIMVKYTLGGKNISLGEQFFDTIRVYSRAADTLYFSPYQGSNQSFAYTLSYEVLDQSPDDPEPNDNFANAKPVLHSETIEGHIGYIANNVTDRSDYFKTLLPVDGTVTVFIEATHTGGRDGSFIFYAYDKSQRQILVKYTLGNKNIKYGQTLLDTITIASRAADSLYFLLYQGSSQSFNYKLRYTMPGALKGDPEPNNNFDQAVKIQLRDTAKGLIGYVANGVNDASDYYKTAIPAYGNLKIFLDAQNTGANSAGFSLYVYDKNRRQVGVKYLTAVDPGDMLKDTLTVNCVTSDSVYVLVYQPSSGRSFTYSLQFAFEAQQPEAKIGYTRAGGTYEFTNQSSLASKYTWNMGNGEQYNAVAPPLITYKPGGYDVRLIVENELCRLRDTTVVKLVVNGLNRYTPETGGAGNIVFTAYGGGFHNGMSIQLKQGGTVYKDSVTWIDERGSVFGALVDMHDAPTGIYDVSFITRDTVYHIPGGFSNKEAVYKVSGEIIGRDIIRANTNSVYTVRIHNEGNVMAGYTEVYLLTPDNLNVTRMDSLIDLTFKTVIQDTLPEVIPVLKSEGYPIDGNMRSYLLAGIPVGGFSDLRFNIRGTAGKDNIYLWVKGPYSGSPFTAKGDDCFKATLKLVADGVFDGVSLVPGLDCFAGGVKAVASAAYNAFGYFFGGSSAGSAAGSLGKTMAGAAKDCAGEVAVLLGVTAEIAPAIEIADMAADAAILVSNAGVNLQQIKDDCQDLEDEKEKPVDVRTSWDPNAKSGPAGFGAARYISGNDRRLSYTIFFENTGDATLPAQQVTILDTLDKNVYNLASFSANSFGFGTRSFKMPLGTGEYVEDVDFNNNLSVRFYISLDQETGIVKATFKTIDNATGAVTEDPLAGFLPPNKLAPEGDGYISFSVEMKEGLPGGTVIANRASIIFDANAPILTEVWSNTIDRNLPTSRITEARKLTDSTLVLKVNGSDLESGVKKYRIYVSENGGSYKYAGLTKDSVVVKGVTGNEYDFYMIAVDAVGNQEDKNSVSEANVKLIPEENPNSEVQMLLYPVPSNGTVDIELNVPETQQLIISVYSATGQRVAELYNGSAGAGNLKISKALHHLSSGLYFVHARGSKGINQKKKLVLVK